MGQAQVTQTVGRIEENMKVRLVEDLQLIVTPENYVEQVALSKWAETHQGAGGLLVEAYAQQKRAVDETICTCEKYFENPTNPGHCGVCGKPFHH